MEYVDGNIFAFSRRGGYEAMVFKIVEGSIVAISNKSYPHVVLSSARYKSNVSS